jgi:hypothetical protein
MWFKRQSIESNAHTRTISEVIVVIYGDLRLCGPIGSCGVVASFEFFDKTKTKPS